MRHPCPAVEATQDAAARILSSGLMARTVHGLLDSMKISPAVGFALATALLGTPAWATSTGGESGEVAETGGEPQGETGSTGTTTDGGEGDTGVPYGGCGWAEPLGYSCEGEMPQDPEGFFPRACPPGLVEGESCGGVRAQGCCDANGDVWRCSPSKMTGDDVLQRVGCFDGDTSGGASEGGEESSGGEPDTDGETDTETEGGEPLDTDGDGTGGALGCSVSPGYPRWLPALAMLPLLAVARRRSGRG